MATQIESRHTDAADTRIQAEARIANQLQREHPALSRTSALSAARQMVSRVDFLDGILASLSLRC
jgi:hypothetical protein